MANNPNSNSYAELCRSIEIQNYLLPISRCASRRTVKSATSLNATSRSDRSQVVTQRGVEGAPTLVVEILSPTTQANDRQAKAQIYAKYAVPHYWLIDPDKQTLEAYTLAGGQYDLASQAQSGDLFTPAMFPSLSFQSSDLWA